jgi:NAD(P)H-hydrate repair Nnr-like enzyme with NAD(P)H-hydrate epimerase domain
MIGLGFALTRTLRGPAQSLARYTSEGAAPVLVLDFASGNHAANPEGWAFAYAAGGVMPALLLDVTSATYGRS